MSYVLRSFVVMFLLASALAGRAQGNRTYVGQDVFVAAGQQVHNATCLFCSVQVEGEVSGRVVVLFGSLNVSGQVLGGTTVVGGNAVVDGQARVGGNAVVVGGNAVYETDEALSGSVYVLGGHMSHLSRAKGEGRSKRYSLSPWLFSVAGMVVLLVLLGVGFGPRAGRRAAMR
ncbi:MAG: hypothetical protein M3Y50_11665 [Acidobacteriota bacterium]|nr:hypothetical protein [Acidobacteriota bacterium]